MTVIDEILSANTTYATAIFGFPLPAPPSRKLAVVTCMDARIDPHAAFGLTEGQAHIIRNAGGVITDDVIRSVTISQRKLGTRHIAVVMHTDCGMATFTGADLLHDVERETGIRPSWAVETFTDVVAEAQQGIRRLQSALSIPYRDSIHGFVFDVATRRLNPVPPLDR